MIEGIISDHVTRSLSAYSHAVNAGDFVYIAGLGPLDRDARLVGEGIAEQTEVTLTNLRHVLNACQATLQDVVRVTAYLDKIRDYEEFNRVYEQHFTSTPYLERTCIGAGELWSGVLIEIDAVAYVPESRE
jgi:2-iminobutanoate/2-iminopropanoate deaminase